MSETQSQRRFLLNEEAQAEWKPLLMTRPVAIIDDGYWEMPDAHVMRLRVIQGAGPVRAFLTRKTGHGRDRDVSHIALASAGEGFLMLNWCHYHLKKWRYVFEAPTDGSGSLTFDVYGDPLKGLMVAELKGHGFVPPPSWTEVTDSLSGLHFAKLAHELTHGSGSDPTDEAMRLAIRLPRIVLTGGPCSGKSTVMEALKKRFGDRLHCVPEVATIVIGQVGVKPWTGGARNLLSAQRLIYRAQRAFEDASDSQARTDGKTAMLLDRGVGDIRAYLPAGVNLERLAHTTVEHEFARYDLVIVLDSPSRDVYEAHKGDNAARTETYEAAAELGRRIRGAWEGHPNFRFVADTPTWEAKEAAVVAHVESFLRQPRP